jgi:class 3 adenylate cyclase
MKKTFLFLALIFCFNFTYAQTNLDSLYNVWGNTASRMESSGEIGKVNISHDTYELIKDDPQFVFESRGKIQAKGKGLLNMYFVTKAM